MNRPTIVAGMSGTRSEKALAVLEAIDRRLRATFPSHAVDWAFTSPTILAKLAADGTRTVFGRGVPVRCADDVLAALPPSRDGENILLPITLALGAEVPLTQLARQYSDRIRLAEPILATPADADRLLDVLAPELSVPDRVAVLCAHGNSKNDGLNETLAMLDRAARNRFENVCLAALEGRVFDERVFTEAVGSGFRAVHFVPLFMAPGRHVERDVFGFSENAWRTKLARLGFTSFSLAACLGERGEIRAWLAERVAAALAADRFFDRRQK